MYPNTTTVNVAVRIRVRSKIEKIDNKTLAIKEIYGKTVASVCDSIVKASEKGKSRYVR